LLHFTNPRCNPLPLKGGERRQDGENDSADTVTSDITAKVDEMDGDSTPF